MVVWVTDTFSAIATPTPTEELEEAAAADELDWGPSFAAAANSAKVASSEIFFAEIDWDPEAAEIDLESEVNGAAAAGTAAGASGGAGSGGGSAG